ncbi:hypothetical protein F2Q69_00063335 [Brassica cretica]|uniref:Uncharacterized protein n=1 Tax=Brassica cretica TaxID=69181 RepID=A0A8S9RC03_BRACR|nr:hypothetical protein F2Q69_00063335 [Brassica cretica]
MEPNGYMKETKRMNGGGGDVAESELDPWTAWAYKPRTISLLLIGACLLIEAIHDGENHKTKRLERSVKQSSIQRKNRREESRAWREEATPASCGAAGVGNHI